MISHEHKLIFIHIPKCAGSSIEEALNHFNELDGDGRQDHRTIRHIEPLRWHSSKPGQNLLELARRVVRSTQPNEQIYCDPGTVCALLQVHCGEKPLGTGIFLVQKKSIGGMVADTSESRQNFRNFVFERAGKRHLRPHNYYLKQFECRITMDLVNRYEALAQGFGEVVNHIGDSNIELPHLLKNKNHQSRHFDFCDSEAKEFVSEVYSHDIKYFGFEIDH